MIRTKLTTTEREFSTIFTHPLFLHAKSMRASFVSLGMKPFDVYEVMIGVLEFEKATGLKFNPSFSNDGRKSVYIGNMGTSYPMMGKVTKTDGTMFEAFNCLHDKSHTRKFVNGVDEISIDEMNLVMIEIFCSSTKSLSSCVLE